MSETGQPTNKARFTRADYDDTHKIKTVDILHTHGISAAKDFTPAGKMTIYKWSRDPRFNSRLPQAGGAPSEEGVVSESLSETVASGKPKGNKRPSVLANIGQVTMVNYCCGCGLDLRIAARAYAVDAAMKQ